MSTYLVDSTDLTAVADAIRTKGGTSASLAFPAGFVSAVEAIETGGGGGWQRPAEWPDYSKLHLVEDEIEAEFFTYDNREAAWGVEIKGGFRIQTDIKSSVVIDRVSIGADGTVTVLDTTTGSTYNGNYRFDYQFSVPADAGDFVCYRVTPASGAHITEIGMNTPAGVTYAYMQRCVERYGNLPYCKKYYGFGSAYTGWGCIYLVSDTILSMPNDVAFIEYKKSFRLKNLPTDGWKRISFGSLGAGGVPSCFTQCASLKNVPADKLDLSSVTNLSSLFLNAAAEKLDLSDVSVAACTNVNSFAAYCQQLKWFRAPKNMTAIVSNTRSDFLRNCYSLEVAEFDETFDSTGVGIGSRWFTEDEALQALILRAESVVPLDSSSAVNAFMKAGGGYCYVPQSVLADYKEATNWSTFANFILPIEGSYWETHHAGGSLIEEVAT